MTLQTIIVQCGQHRTWFEKIAPFIFKPNKPWLNCSKSNIIISYAQLVPSYTSIRISNAGGSPTRFFPPGSRSISAEIDEGPPIREPRTFRKFQEKTNGRENTASKLELNNLTNFGCGDVLNCMFKWARGEFCARDLVKQLATLLFCWVLSCVDGLEEGPNKFILHLSKFIKRKWWILYRI